MTATSAGPSPATATDTSSVGLRRWVKEIYEVGQRYDGRPVAVPREGSVTPFFLDTAEGRRLWQWDILHERRWGRDVEPDLDKLATTVLMVVSNESTAAAEGAAHVLTWLTPTDWRAAIDVADDRGWKRGAVVDAYVQAAMRDSMGELVDAEKVRRSLDEAASSFEWTDLAETWEDDPPRPSHLARVDGSCGLYLGQRNLVVGYSESGKTWLAMLLVRQEVDAGRPVVVFDHENGPVIITDRLRSLGLTRDQVKRYVRYASLEKPLPPELAEELAVKFWAEGARVVIVDAATPVAHAMGLDLNGGDTGAVEQVYRTVLDPWAQTGYAAMLMDNTPKGAKLDILGSQHKLAGIGGIVLAVAAEERFYRGHAGHSKVFVIKDRSGTTDCVMDGDRRLWGTLHMAPDAVSVDAVNVRVTPPPAAAALPAAASIASVMDIISDTCALAAESLRRNGLTEVRSMRRLADLMAVVHGIDTTAFPAAHIDRDHITDCLTKVADASARAAAGIDLVVISTAKSTRYRVWLT